MSVSVAEEEQEWIVSSTVRWLESVLLLKEVSGAFFGLFFSLSFSLGQRFPSAAAHGCRQGWVCISVHRHWCGQGQSGNFGQRALGTFVSYTDLRIQMRARNLYSGFRVVGIKQGWWCQLKRRSQKSRLQQVALFPPPLTKSSLLD